MTKKDILDYVMSTPYNTNRAVLSGMLEDIAGQVDPSDVTEILVEMFTCDVTITNSTEGEIVVDRMTIISDKIENHPLSILVGETKKVVCLSGEYINISGETNNAIDGSATGDQIAILSKYNYGTKGRLLISVSGANQQLTVTMGK